MKIKQARTSLGVTINLGNYENLKPEVEVVMEFDENESVEDVLKAGWDIVTEQIRTQYKTVKQGVTK